MDVYDLAEDRRIPYMGDAVDTIDMSDEELLYHADYAHGLDTYEVLTLN